MTNFRTPKITTKYKICLNNFGRKTYCLKILGFSTLLLNVKYSETVPLFLMGCLTYNHVCKTENWEILRSSRQRVFALLWLLLSSHKFNEAVSLWLGVITKLDINSSWLWKLAFTSCSIKKAPSVIQNINKKMFETAFPDENTRKLETILAMMKFRRWDAAVSNQNLPVKNKHRDLSCEAEYLHLMLLQRLYYGLSYYANWLERGMIDDLAGMRYGGALVMLSDVSSLIAAGDIADIFLRPYLSYHCKMGSVKSIIDVFETHTDRCSEHPNAYRYLAEAYLCSSEDTEISLPRTPIDFRDAIKNLHPDNSYLEQIIECLAKYSLSLLPTVAPPVWNRGDTNWHYMIANICLEYEFKQEALEILFHMLDHPSWCKYDRVWKLLEKALLAADMDKQVLNDLWSDRASYWNRHIFTNPEISPDAHGVWSKLSQISSSDTHLEVHSDDESDYEL